MKKRFLSTLLALCMMLTLLPTAARAEDTATSGTCGDNVFWSYDEGTKTLTISGTGDMEDYDILHDSYAPWYSPYGESSQIKNVVINYGVTSIGQDSFAYFASLANVSIPQGITRIGPYAFLCCENLSSIVIPDSVITIGYNAFAGCTNLTNVKLSSNLTSIEDSAFGDCSSLVSIDIPSSVTSMGDHVFDRCTNLDNIVIPYGVTRIGERTFSQCSNLKNISIPNSVTSIGYCAFSDCISLTEINIPDSVTSIEDSAFSVCRSLKSISIPNSVKIIGGGLFEFCDNLTSVSLPNSVESIESSAFFNCKNLSSISIPTSVKSIGTYAFHYSNNLKDVYYAGSETEWKNIAIEQYNDPLTSANIHYGSTGPDIGPISSAQWTSLFPANGTTDIEHTYAKFYITFDREIASIEGQPYVADVDLTMQNGFAIYRASDDKLIYTPSQYETHNFILNTAKDRVSITPTNGNLLFEPDTEYYIVMRNGFVNFKDGATNQAINKGDWMFTTAPIPVDETGFKLGVDTLSFNNVEGFFGSNAFKISDEYYNKLKEVLSFKERCLIADQKWRDFMNNLMKGFGGECFGMTTVMARMYAKQLSPEDWGGENTFSLDTPKNDEYVASLIYYHHLLQALPQFLNEDRKETQESIARELVSALLDGTSPVIVNIETLAGEHSILAYAIDEISDSNKYIIYVADPNCLALVKGPDATAAPPSLLYIDKNSYRPTSLISGMNGRDSGVKSFVSVISDFSLFDRFNLESQWEGVTHNIPSLGILATTAASFTIESGGRQAVVQDGNIVKDDLPIYTTYKNLNGTNEAETFIYCIENADSYKMTLPASNTKYNTSMTFGNVDIYSSVNSNASTISFNSNGTVSIDNSTSSSDISTTTASTFDSWYVLTVTSEAANLVLTPKSGECAISSSESLGNISIIGSDDWNETTLSANVTGNNAHALEITKPSAATELVLKSDDGSIIANSPMSYSVIYMTQGGSFVDAVMQVPYGSKITAPTNPTYPGYSFGGWYKDNACSAGQEWNFDTDTVTENIALYAKWNKGTSGGSGSSGSSGSSGGSSGGSSSATSSGTNSITVPTVTGGKVSVSPKSASKGTKITITATPDQGYQLDSISVVDAAKKQIDLTKISDTQYSFIMPGSKVQIAVNFKKIEVEPEEKVTPFDDVSANAYYYDAVLWAVEKGITSGTTATTFSPDNTCTRAQTVTFLWRAAGSPAPASRENPFIDLKPGAYYYDAVLWAVEKGITSGTTKTTFDPDATVTRGQTVTFLYRVAGSPAAEGRAAFTDIADGAYYANAVTWAAANGITGGTTPTTFSPSNGCTRAQIVTFLYRANN